MKNRISLILLVGIQIMHAMEPARERTPLLSTVLQVSEPQELAPDAQGMNRVVRDVCKIFYNEKLNKNIGCDDSDPIAKILRSDFARWNKSLSSDHPLQQTVAAHNQYRATKDTAKKRARAIRSNPMVIPGITDISEDVDPILIDRKVTEAYSENYEMLQKQAAQWLAHAVAQNSEQMQGEITTAQQRIAAWRKRFGGGIAGVAALALFTLVSGYFNVHCELAGD